MFIIFKNKYFYRIVKLEQLKLDLQNPHVLPSINKQKKSDSAVTPPPTPYGTPYIKTQHLVENMTNKLEQL